VRVESNDLRNLPSCLAWCLLLLCVRDGDDLEAGFSVVSRVVGGQ
jgi:hypothetical protein